MKTIMCYGDSNTWGAMPMQSPGDSRRYDVDTRWPGVMRNVLNSRAGDYWVAEEGLNARTTAHDDPIEGLHKNGAKFLQVALETHQPLDLVIIMLGTNDLKYRFSVNAMDIARSAANLAATVMSSTTGPNLDRAPAALLVAPPPLRLPPAPFFSETFAGGQEKSEQLSDAFVLHAERVGCPVFDARHYALSSDTDGIHFEAKSHHDLGTALAERVQELI